MLLELIGVLPAQSTENYYIQEQQANPMNKSGDHKSEQF